MKCILVTGGAGFIGTNFVYYWLDKYPRDHIIVLDALTYAGNRLNLIAADKVQNFKFVHGNILNQDLVERLLKEENINTIVHFAAESHVDRSIHSPDDFINTNIVGTHSLLKAARKIWIDRQSKDHRFHHVSTDEVFGTLSPADPPFSETTPYAPNSPYADSKASLTHPESLIRHVTDRAGHDRRYAINAEKITSDLGYLPEENFETGIAKNPGLVSEK